MVSTSKILTVSYGTFSCTLEGFDDSFDTMKAIAEYFRDLAADDRYFGAEPPTPDAEMLARIAEREIARRVEAHNTDGRIHLRARPATALQAAPQGGTAEDRPAMSSAPDMAGTSDDGYEDLQDASVNPVQTQDVVAAQPATPVAQPAAPAQPAQTQPAETQAEQTQADGDSVVDRLRRIRAVAGAGLGGSAVGGSATPVPAMPDFDTAYSEDEDADTLYSEAPQAVDFLTETASDLDAALAEDDMSEPAIAPDAAPEAQPQSEQPQMDDADDQSDVQDDTIAPQPQADAPLMDDADQPDERDDAIAPEQEQEQNDAHDTTVATSEPPSQPDMDAEQDMLSRLSASDDTGMVAPGLNIDDSADKAEDNPLAGLDLSEDDDEVEGEDDLSNLLNSVMAEDEDDNDLYEDGDDHALDTDEDTLSQLLADALGTDMATPQIETAPQASVDAITDDLQADIASDTVSEVTVEATQLRARVIKMKRADLDAALGVGTIEEQAEDDTPQSSLSEQAEAELQRELAEVQAELRQSRAPDAETAPDAVLVEDISADMDDQIDAVFEDGLEDDLDDQNDSDLNALDLDDDDSDEEEDTQGAVSPKRAVRLDTIGADAQATRIFDEADTQLEEPESNKRRNAIQHLRAAVAATKAERSAGGAMGRDVDDQPYRMDLESAVRPRRPQAIGSDAPRAERPSSARPAPLKLVAEQRIDAPVQPVRPRRISRADLESRPRPAAQSASAVSAEPTPRTTSTQVPTPTRVSTAPSPAPKQASGQGSFTEFADAKGARGLTDLLEAAAAYMSDVEGMDQFSRPMLMQKLREVDDSEFSREEGLRSFGQLLRQGKLQKLKGGRFAVTEETEFRQSA
ncbi:hypothetical protein OO012_03710 [Rhodobacteraceae bacterium KMM 6894]|nr:hypothetical protein [Rhodobacteraceae bacterium KMM 6894]